MGDIMSNARGQYSRRLWESLVTSPIKNLPNSRGVTRYPRKKMPLKKRVCAIKKKKTKTIRRIRSWDTRNAVVVVYGFSVIGVRVLLSPRRRLH